MKTTQITIITIALIVGLGGGYLIGKSSANNEMNMQMSTNTSSDMTAHMESMKKMAEMMKTSGMMMQETGMKYKDDAVTIKGKDMEVVADKYMKENTATSSMDHSMPNMMHH